MIDLIVARPKTSSQKPPSQYAFHGLAIVAAVNNMQRLTGHEIPPDARLDPPPQGA